MTRAIALCGGGSRGSYELGVWTALRENEIDYDIVTGTSIGSLNGALMVQQDYELTRNLWREITVTSVMENGINLDTSIERMLNQKGDLRPFLKKYAENRGADISPLRNLLGRVINEERFHRSPVNFGLIAVAFPSLQPCRLCKSELPAGRLVDWLLASAACFPAFPMQMIDGKAYIDGGYYDNLPIRYAFWLGAEELIAVDLSYPPIHREYLRHPLVTYIHPSWNLGSILLFDPEVMANNTTLGYNDAQKAFGRYMGWRYTFRVPHPEQYEDTAKRFCAFLAQVEARVADPGKRTLYRPASPVSDILAEHCTARTPNALGLLLRSLECLAERLSVDHLAVYEIPEMVDILEAKLRDNSNQTAARFPISLSSISSLSSLTPLYPTVETALFGLLERLRAAAAEDSGALFREAETAAQQYPRDLASVLGLLLLSNPSTK